MKIVPTGLTEMSVQTVEGDLSFLGSLVECKVYFHMSPSGEVEHCMWRHLVDTYGASPILHRHVLLDVLIKQ